MGAKNWTLIEKDFGGKISSMDIRRISVIIQNKLFTKIKVNKVNKYGTNRMNS